MIISVYHDNLSFKSRIQYVFDFLEAHPLCEGKLSFEINPDAVRTENTLHYQAVPPDNGEFDLFIPAQEILFSNSPVSLAQLVSNNYKYQEFELHSVENQSKSQQSFFKEGEFGFDLVEMIFFHLSRWEEHHCETTQKDIQERMLSEEQFLVKHGIFKIPVVDHLVFCFLECVGLLPEKRLSEIRLTYDVDIIRRFGGKIPMPPLRSIIKYLFVKPDFQSFVKLCRSYLKAIIGFQDPYDVFDQMWQKTKNCKQVAYFLVDGNSKYDKPFPLLDERLAAVMGIAKERNIEVALHPSYDAWLSVEITRKEKLILENMTGGKVEKSRQHFLHFSPAQTPQVLEDAGIIEDSSLGFSDKIGFRCGTGFPYRLYDLETESPFNLTEVPLCAMDVSLMREGKFDAKKVNQLWDDFLNLNSSLTCLTFNFHNSRFFDAQLDGIDLKAMFERLRNSLQDR